MNQTETLSKIGHLLNRPKSVRPPRKRIRQVSPKRGKGGVRGYIRRETPARAAQKARYRAMLPGWIREHPVCEVCPIINANGFSVRCLGKTRHPHHVKGRRGELLCDERWMLACCGGESHPQFIHQTHKQDAINLGLLIQR